MADPARAPAWLEPAFRDALQDIADERGLSCAALIAQIDGERGDTPLVSALRTYAVAWFRRCRDGRAP